MTEPNCPVCEKELYEEHSGFDGLNLCDSNNQMDDSFIAREFSCQNKKCPIYKKKLEVFWDFTRYELEGEEKEFN